MFRLGQASVARMRPRSGFTIVELMLAVSILMILAAFLYPLISRARDLAYRTQCANNLRQFGVAFSLYADDWSGYWPCPGGKVGDWSYWAQSGNGGLQPYVRQRGLKSIWCCPVMQEWRSQYPARTYCMNSYLRIPSDVEYYGCVNFVCGVNIAKIAEPRGTILLYEGLALTTGWENSTLYNYIYRCANWQYVRGYPPKLAYVSDPQRAWHGRLNNYLYCDGHVIARPPGPRTVAVLSTYREMRQWYEDEAHYEDIYTRNWARLVPRD